MLARDPVDESSVLPDGAYLLRVAHDAFVGSEVVPEVIRLEEQSFRLEAEEGFLETRPFLLDHAPHEPGGKDPLRHD